MPAVLVGGAAISRKSPVRLRLDELVAAVSSREGAAANGDLEPFDRAVCEAARHVLFAYTDEAGWLPGPDVPLAENCCSVLENATKCMDSSAYKDADLYAASVNEKLYLFRRFAQGEKIETVLQDVLVGHVR